MFDIPVVLFIFKRTSAFEHIFEVLRNVRPETIYIVADGPRSEEEAEACTNCRNTAISMIDWPCRVIRNFAEENRGVINNIGEGALWVLSQEPWAIFLEDDNCPTYSFFTYCRELLLKYRESDKVLWICGTNYVTDMKLETSYVFTQHLLPCGWASWSDKFIKYYDINLDTLESEDKVQRFKQSYDDRRLMKQQLHSVEQTKYMIENDRNRSSWDYQMLFSLRSNGLYGIAPCMNQIKNIGADDLSIHGGNTTRREMTGRFCLIDTKEMTFPLRHPEQIETNEEFERITGEIILQPLRQRLLVNLGKIIKVLLGLNPNASLTSILKDKRRH